MKITTPYTHPVNTPPTKAYNKTSFKLNSALKNIQNIAENPIYTLVVIDVLGMVLPRVVIDTARNRKELGHLNYHAGRETLIREALSIYIDIFLPATLIGFFGNKLLQSKKNKLGLDTTALIDNKTLKEGRDIINDVLNDYSHKGKSQVNILTLREQVAQKFLHAKLKLDAPTSKNLVDAVRIGFFSNIDYGMQQSPKDILKNSLFLKEVLWKEMRQEESTQKMADKLEKALEKMPKDRLRKFFIKQKAHMREILANKLIDQLFQGEAAKNNVGVSIANVLRDTFILADDILLKSFNVAHHNTVSATKNPLISVDTMKGVVANVMEEFGKLKKLKLATYVVALVATIATPAFNRWFTEKITGRKEFVGIYGLIENDYKKNK